MNEKEDTDYVPEVTSSSARLGQDGSKRRNDANCNTEESTSDSFDLKDCSNAVEDIPKEASIPCGGGDDDDDSHVSDYSSASEEYADPVGNFPAEEDEQEAKAELNSDEDEEIEADEEHLKEVQKDWSDEDVQMHRDEALSLKNEGNQHFKNASYTDAINSYTQALNTCPLKCSSERAVLYANRAAAKIGLEQKEEAVLDCNKAIELNPSYLKAVLRRAQLHRKLENLDQCLADYQKVLELDPNSNEARQACMVLPQEIAERNEKLKTEMLGQLKNLGNQLLRPFGLSTDNFNFVQDPNTGGYSINFQNTKNGK